MPDAAYQRATMYEVRTLTQSADPSFKKMVTDMKKLLDSGEPEIRELPVKKVVKRERDARGRYIPYPSRPSDPESSLHSVSRPSSSVWDSDAAGAGISPGTHSSAYTAFGTSCNCLRGLSSRGRHGRFDSLSTGCVRRGLAQRSLNRGNERVDRKASYGLSRCKPGHLCVMTR